LLLFSFYRENNWLFNIKVIISSTIIAWEISRELLKEELPPGFNQTFN